MPLILTLKKHAKSVKGQKTMTKLLQVLLMTNCIYEGEAYVKAYIENNGISYSRFNSQAILAKLDDIIHINNHFIRIDKTENFLDRIQYTINDIKENE